MYGAKEVPYKIRFFFFQIREMRKRSKESFQKKKKQKDIHTDD